MELRFNNGRGAITCDKCHVIVDEGFTKHDWETYVNLHKKGLNWYCKECAPELQEFQTKCFAEEFKRTIKDVPVL